MKIYENEYYMEDVHYVANLALPWEKLQNKSVMLSGATGLIGSFFIDVILEKNLSDDLNCTIYALGRNEEKARERFSKFKNEIYSLTLFLTMLKKNLCAIILERLIIFFILQQTHIQCYIQLIQSGRS